MACDILRCRLCLRVLLLHRVVYSFPPSADPKGLVDSPWNVKEALQNESRVRKSALIEKLVKPSPFLPKPASCPRNKYQVIHFLPSMEKETDFRVAHRQTWIRDAFDHANTNSSLGLHLFFLLGHDQRVNRSVEERVLAENKTYGDMHYVR